MDSPWCPVLLAALAVSLCSSPARADRKFGKDAFKLCCHPPSSSLSLSFFSPPSSTRDAKTYQSASVLLNPF